MNIYIYKWKWMGPSVDTQDPPVFHLKVSWFSIAWLWNYSLASLVRRVWSCIAHLSNDRGFGHCFLWSARALIAISCSALHWYCVLPQCTNKLLAFLLIITTTLLGRTLLIKHHSTFHYNHPSGKKPFNQTLLYFSLQPSFWGEPWLYCSVIWWQ